jgi:hypothetical protein
LTSVRAHAAALFVIASGARVDSGGSRGIAADTLRSIKPELFDASTTKYDTTSARKLILKNNPIPLLNIFWNAAIHTSTVHPQLIHDAKRAVGLPVQPMEYFEIPVEKFPRRSLRHARCDVVHEAEDGLQRHSLPLGADAIPAALRVLMDGL